jgi:hypothetical protein
MHVNGNANGFTVIKTNVRYARQVDLAWAERKIYYH